MSSAHDPAGTGRDDVRGPATAATVGVHAREHRRSNVTIRMVAERAGVGVASVSRVLSGHPDVSPRMRDVVLQAAQECGYEMDLLARSLRSGQTLSVGIVVADILNPFLASIISGAEEELRKSGYSVLLANSHGESARDVESIRNLLQRRVDGMILSVSDEAAEGMAPLLSRLQPGTVLLDREIDGVAASAVLTDHHRGMRSVVDHLTSLRHRRIALVLGQMTVRPTRERKRGFVEAMETHGIEVPEELIRSGSFSIDFGYQETVALLRSPNPPTAVVAGGNQLLTGVLRAVRELDVDVPGKLSVVGCDDFALAQLHRPAITILQRDAHLMGRTAAAQLVEDLGREELEPLQVTLGTNLTVRESTGPAPG
jgi:LacI family transcriptional regulator